MNKMLDDYGVSTIILLNSNTWYFIQSNPSLLLFLFVPQAAEYMSLCFLVEKEEMVLMDLVSFIRYLCSKLFLLAEVGEWSPYDMGIALLS